MSRFTLMDRRYGGILSVRRRAPNNAEMTTSQRLARRRVAESIEARSSASYRTPVYRSATGTAGAQSKQTLWAMSARTLGLTPSKAGASGCPLTLARASATAVRVEASSGKDTSSGLLGLPPERAVLDSEGGSRMSTSSRVGAVSYTHLTLPTKRIV